MMAELCSARNLSSQVVGADPDQAWMNSDSREGSVGEEELWISFSISLAIVEMRIRESNTLGHRIQSLGDGIKTRAGAEWNSCVEESRVSISRSLAIESCSTGDWLVESVDTGS